MPVKGDVDELMAAVGLANKTLLDNSAAAKELLQEQEEERNKQITLVERAGNADKVVLQAEGLAALEAQRRTQEMAVKLGTNPDESGEIMTKLAGEWKQAAVQASDSAKKLSDDLSLNFFDKPFDYIKAQITMENTIKQADADAGRRNTNFQALSQAHQLTQSGAASANALKVTVTDATLQAAMDKTEAAVQAKASELRIQNAGIQMQGLQQLNSMTLQEVNNLNTAYSAQNQEFSKRMQQKSMQMQEAEFAQRKKEFDQRMADKKASVDDLKGIADTVKAGAAALGFKEITAMEPGKIIQMLNMKASGFDDFLKAGIRSQTFGNATVTDNAGEAARMVSTHSAPLRPEQGTVKTFLQSVWQKAASPEGARESGGYDHTKVDQVSGGAARLAVIGAQNMQANINPLDGSNIYAAPPLPSVVMLPAIQRSAWYKSVLADQMATGQLKEFNSEQLTSMTVSALKEKKISFNEAASGLQAMHAGAAHVNNAMKNFAGLGLPIQSTFRTQLSPIPGFSKPNTYDLSSAADINRLLMARMAAEQRAIIYTNPAVK